MLYVVQIFLRSPFGHTFSHLSHCVSIFRISNLLRNACSPQVIPTKSLPSKDLQITLHYRLISTVFSNTVVDLGATPLSSISFIFMQFLAEIMPNNTLGYTIWGCRCHLGNSGSVTEIDFDFGLKFMIIHSWWFKHKFWLWMPKYVSAETRQYLETLNRIF